VAITVSDLKVSLQGLISGNRWECVQWYRLNGAAFLTATPVGVGEAWWNDIKAAWRGLYISTAIFTFEQVIVAEPGLTGQYGTFAIPTGEKQGTRSSTADNEALPPFCAAGIRLTVGSRVTRPGQKRPPLLVEADSDNGNVASGTVTLLNTLAAKYSTMQTLGAPVATGNMSPEIVRLNTATQEIDVKQDVTGYVLNARVTTQNSRKFGRGI